MTTEQGRENTLQSPSVEKKHEFVFTGTIDGMLPIIFKNLIFNVITLSLYRFWARTNIRKYIWENTKFMGDPFEYTGTGGELFKGMIITLVIVFLPLFALIAIAQFLMASGNPLGGVVFALVYVCILLLLPLAIYRTQKYRLSRTRWRGIRGALDESGVGFAFKFIGYMFLTLITLGLAFPLMENKLWSLQLNKTSFGSGRCHYNATSGGLYKAFFISLAIAIGIAIVLTVLIGASVMSDLERETPSAATIISLFLAYIVYMIGLAFAFLLYSYTKLVHLINNTHYETARLQFDGTLKELFFLIAGNVLLIVFTFGIAFPVTQMRNVRYIMENLSLEGDLDLEKISQSTGDEPSFGEGLADGFDMGTI